MVTGNKKQRSRLIQLLIVVGIVAVIGISFGLNVLGAKKHSGVPDTFLGMKLGSYVGGAEALRQVNQLHGTGIKLTGAIIAEYSANFNPYHNNNQDKVEVWIGKTQTTAASADLVDRMYQGIQQGKGNTPFRNAQKTSVDGQEIYQVDGPGGTHCFYAVAEPEPRVVWLTIDSANPAAVLQEALKFF